MTAQAATAPGADATDRGPWRRLGEFLSRPLVDYFFILSCVALLCAIGLVMVATSSSADSIAKDHHVWYYAVKQSLTMLIGLVFMWITMKVPPRLVKRLALVAVIATTLLLILVLFLGVGQHEVGSKSWLVLGPLRFQPSELAKVAIGIYGASVFDKVAPGKLDRRAMTKFLLVSGGFFVLILIQHDLGMAMAFATMVAFVLIFIGVPWILLGAMVGVGIVLLVAMTFLRSGYRADRLTVYWEALRGHFEDSRNMAYQSYQGFLSLAEGSVSGVGIGQSRAKWFYLPEAQNDFIFSILGEETGLIGGVIVIGLYSFLLFFGLRCAARNTDRFLSLLAASMVCGVVSQAYINIAYVIGLLPVTGIQLPLISAGGTSLVITLVAMGLLATCARYEPDAVATMQSSGRPLIDRILILDEPRPDAGISREPRLTRRPRVTRPIASNGQVDTARAKERGSSRGGSATRTTAHHQPRRRPRGGRSS